MSDSKKTRRPKGDGSIKFDPEKKKWVARITAHRADGTPYRKTFEGKTQRETAQKRDEWKALHDKVPAGKREMVYLSDYIMTWMQNVKKGSIKLTTYERYLRDVKTHIIPSVGNLRLINLSTSTIQTELCNKMRDAKDSNGNELYSFSAIRNAFNTLHSCLQYAVDVGDISLNPCDKVQLPTERKANTKQISPLSDDEAKQFLLACEMGVSQYEWVYKLILYTGLREGEACALRPDDVNLENGYLSIHATIIPNIDSETGTRAKGFVYQNSTKTKKDRRAYFGDDARTLLIERLKSCPNGCYLANESQTPVNLVYLGRQFKKVCERANITTNHTLHDLRHTCATKLVQSGTDAKTVSAQLGHSNIKTTLDYYVHPSENDKANAMRSLHWD